MLKKGSQALQPPGYDRSNQEISCYEMIGHCGTKQLQNSMHIDHSSCLFVTGMVNKASKEWDARVL